MKITPLAINDAFLIEREEVKDERGAIIRQYSKSEFASFRLDFEVKQSLVSKNYKAGVLRGLHYQKEPYSEIKLVSCLRGKIYDVMVDIRPDSSTYLQWISLELSEADTKLLYVPCGIAHGFQTMEPNTLVYYQLSEVFMPDYCHGILWNDPKLNIKWPDFSHRLINERDMNHELLK